jgi:putative membrane protein
MFLLRVISTMVAILIIAWLFPSIMLVDGPIAALVAAFILGIVNGFLRPVLIILTLPITLVSFGFFLLIINGLMLGLVSFIVPGFYVNGLLGATIGAVLISIVSWILSATMENR